MAALSICAFALSAPLTARAQRATIDVPAGRLSDSIATLAAQTGISIGAAGRLPDRRTPAVRGQMDVGRALDLLLAGSGWRARRISASVWRLEPAPVPRAAETRRRADTSPPPVETQPEAGEIVVTGRKRRELLAHADAAIGVVSGDRLAERGGLAGAAAVAERIDGLTVTSLGSGRNRLFVRGVADSPFDGFGQAAVSVAVDEARVSYDAPDPDLRLVDVERVELLKGPQGPLYGTGALGGIYRIVTRKPDPAGFAASVSLGGTAVRHGRAGSDAQAMVNLPLGPTAALRGIVYRAFEPGWIDDRGDGADRNSGRIFGARASLHAEPVAGWTAELVGAVQDADYRDSQYVDGAARHSRPARIAEPHDSDFQLGSLTIRGSVGEVAVTSVSSLTHQELRATYDASAAAAALGAAAPARYRDDRRYSVITQELRFAGPEAGRFSWLAGLSLLDAGTNARGDLTDASGSRPILTLTRRVLELAAFGERRLRLGERLSLALGGRLFHSSVEDEKREQQDAAAVRRYRLFLSPSASLRWSDGGTTLYLRYAEALRPGGAAVEALGQRDPAYALDEIQTVEAGIRRTANGLSLTADLFHSSWQNVQADFLRPDGLVTTHNAGDAVDYGAELSIDWRAGGWLLGGGAIVHRGRLTRATAFAAQSDDLRLPVTSDVALRGSVGRSFSLGGWRGEAALSGNFVGPSRLSFDPGLDRRMPGRVLLNLGLGASRGGWAIRTGVENLLDSSADAFAFGNPFAARTTSQHTPVRPRALRVTVSRHF